MKNEIYKFKENMPMAQFLHMMDIYLDNHKLRLKMESTMKRLGHPVDLNRRFKVKLTVVEIENKNED